MRFRMVFSFTCPINQLAPDEGVDGWFPSGESVLASYTASLRASGVDAGDVRPYKFYGWIARLRVMGRHFDVLLQLSDLYIITVQQVGYFNFLTSTEGYPGCLERLSALTRRWIAHECSGEVKKVETEQGTLSF